MVTKRACKCVGTRSDSDSSFLVSRALPRASAEEGRRCRPGNYFVPGNLLLSSPQSSCRELEGRSLDFRIEPAREVDTLPSASAEVHLLKSQCRPCSYPGLCCELQLLCLLLFHGPVSQATSGCIGIRASESPLTMTISGPIKTRPFHRLQYLAYTLNQACRLALAPLLHQISSNRCSYRTPGVAWAVSSRDGYVLCLLYMSPTMRR